MALLGPNGAPVGKREVVLMIVRTIEHPDGSGPTQLRASEPMPTAMVLDLLMSGLAAQHLQMLHQASELMRQRIGIPPPNGAAV